MTTIRLLCSRSRPRNIESAANVAGGKSPASSLAAFFSSICHCRHLEGVLLSNICPSFKCSIGYVGQHAHPLIHAESSDIAAGCPLERLRALLSPSPLHLEALSTVSLSNCFSLSNSPVPTPVASSGL